MPSGVNMLGEDRQDFIRLVILFSCILVALSILNCMSLALDFLFFNYVLVSFFVVIIAATCYLFRYYPQSIVFLIASFVAVAVWAIFIYVYYALVLWPVAMVLWAFAFWKTGKSHFKKLAVFWAIYFATVAPIAFKVLGDVEFVIFFPMVIGILPGLALICAFRYELLSSKAG